MSNLSTITTRAALVRFLTENPDLRFHYPLRPDADGTPRYKVMGRKFLRANSKDIVFTMDDGRETYLAAPAGHFRFGLTIDGKPAFGVNINGDTPGAPVEIMYYTQKDKDNE